MYRCTSIRVKSTEGGPPCESRELRRELSPRTPGRGRHPARARRRFPGLGTDPVRGICPASDPSPRCHYPSAIRCDPRLGESEFTTPPNPLATIIAVGPGRGPGRATGGQDSVGPTRRQTPQADRRGGSPRGFGRVGPEGREGAERPSRLRSRRCLAVGLARFRTCIRSGTRAARRAVRHADDGRGDPEALLEPVALPGW